MSETVYSRAPDVVWRLGPDRVLVRRIGDQGEAKDLQGSAALVWVSLDEPATEYEITERLVGADVRIDSATGIRLLVEASLVAETMAE